MTPATLRRVWLWGPKEGSFRVAVRATCATRSKVGTGVGEGVKVYNVALCERI